MTGAPTTSSSEDTHATMLVTVVVCTRNRTSTIADSIKSIISQDFPPDAYELIIVDDDSSDGTGEVARRFASDGPPSVRYVHQQYGGLSVARNRAITDGRGDLICFMDDDAEATPGWLAALVDAANRHADVDCFGGRLVIRLEAKAPRTCGAESLGAQLDLGPEEQVITRVKGANMAMRRSAFERVGLFNPALVWRGDEDNWMHRLHELGGRAMYVPEALVWHRRLKSDLRWRTLLKTRFGWGIGQVQLKRETGLPLRRRTEFRALRKALRHAIKDRCTGGLLEAAIKFGVLWGATFGESEKPQQVAPKLTTSEAP